MAKRTFIPEQVINKVREAEVLNGRFTAAELCPTPEEVQNRIKLTISSFESSQEENKS